MKESRSQPFIQTQWDVNVASQDASIVSEMMQHPYNF